MLKKIWNVASTVVVCAVVILAVLLAGARLVGLQVYTVLSGSMEPNYHVGSIIYVKKVEPSDLQVGDAISFMLNENTVATHRIVEIVPDDEDPTVLRFRTKGDNNSIEDSSLVHCKNVLGRVVGTIPYLGYVSDFVQNPPGTYFLVAAVAIMALLVFVPDIIGQKKELDAEMAAQKAAPVSSEENQALRAELEALKAQLEQQNSDSDPS